MLGIDQKTALYAQVEEFTETGSQSKVSFGARPSLELALKTEASAQFLPSSLPILDAPLRCQKTPAATEKAMAPTTKTIREYVENRGRIGGAQTRIASAQRAQTYVENRATMALRRVGFMRSRKRY